MMKSPIEIVPGIYQLQLPVPFEVGKVVAQTNVYLIRGNAGWLLVDTGWDSPQTLDAFHEGIKQLGVNYDDICKIVVTHYHPDHFGLAGKLQRLSGGELALHEKDKPFIEPMGPEAEYTVQEMRRWLTRNGTPEAELPDIFLVMVDVGYPDIFFSGGEKLITGFFDFTVVWTPGHSPGHICLYERERKLLISGDNVLDEISPEIGSAPFLESNPLGDYLKSLQRIRKLDVELTLPAHGSPFTHFHKRIDELVQHHRERLGIILGSLDDGPKKVYDVASRVPWIPQRGGIGWEKLDILNRRMALWETWAHLRLLEEEGKARTFMKDDFLFYNSTLSGN